jgi:hypothetical protein
VRIFDVWIHVETSAGPVESPTVSVEVRGAAEGQRARLISVR